MVKNMMASKMLNTYPLKSSNEKIRIKPEFRDLIIPLDKVQLNGLTESILKDGCTDPLITWKGWLLDGHNRHAICTKHNVYYETKEVKNLGNDIEAKRWILNRQLKKRNLTKEQRMEYALQEYELARLEAAERQKKTHFKKNNKAALTIKQTSSSQNTVSLDLGSPFERENKGKTLEILAQKAGVKRATLENYKKIREASPELKQAVLNGDMAVDKARREIRKQERRQNYERMEWPKGKYRVIYADPPWSYNDKRPLGYGGAEDYYDTMNLADICKLPVAELADKEAVLYLWATIPLLPDALEVIKAWGFFYRSLFVWDKVKHNVGTYNSVRSELLLIAVNNNHKPCIPDNPVLVDNVQVIERTKHSEKPEEFRKIIEKNYHYGNKIELFARKKTKGWEVWGNEIGK
jgi:N6-adenosine-specific RNA methylase IME4